MTSPGHKSRRAGNRGHAVIETALMLPWIVFLFVGVLDFGFYSYAAISVQNAARVAALNTSLTSGTVSDTGGACYYAVQEVLSLPGVTSGMSCTALPLKVAASGVTGPDGKPASVVAVTYQTLPLIPIPGLLTGRMTMTRNVYMRVKGN